MKYTIEIEDEPCMYECGIKFYQCKNVPYWSISDRNISKLEPYTEPDRKDIEDEVWEFARGLLNYADDDWEVITNMLLLDIPYQEAKAKYESWVKQKDEIHVGDEVIIPGDINYDKMIITRLWKDMYDSDAVDTIGYDGRICSFLKCKVKKTGRHFDEVEELLDKMRGNEGE